MTLVFQTDNGESVNLETLLKMWADSPESLRASDVPSVLKGAARLGLANQMALWIMVERWDLVNVVENVLFGSTRSYYLALQT